MNTFDIQPTKQIGEIQFFRVPSDTNGNPRFVVHFLDLLVEGETSRTTPLRDLYALAIRRANQIGGRKYRARWFGGGVVFQSYCLEELHNDILAIRDPRHPFNRKGGEA